MIGAGASGMMCALIAARGGANVTLVERNDRCGRKLAITGKGRCNVTNACDRETFLRSVMRNPRFLYSAWAAFPSEETMRFFEDLGGPLKVERGARVFPQSDRAADIVSALENACRIAGVRIRKGTADRIETENGAVRGVHLKNGETLSADRVVIACGGMGYPSTGSDGSGYRLARQCGHTVVPPRQSLVPWETEQTAFCASLQGLSLKNVALRVTDGTEEVGSDFGEMMFAHFGVTGPMILSASAYLQPGMVLHIDLKPALSADQLDKRLLSDLSKLRLKQVQNAFGELLPHKLILPFLALCGISPSARCCDLSKEDRRRVVETLKDLRLTAARPRPFAEAIITAGGVAVSEVDPKTMRSRKTDGLLLCGEVLDVDALTGGFNLQIAFSTGFLAGKTLAEDGQ